MSKGTFHIPTVCNTSAVCLSPSLHGIRIQVRADSRCSLCGVHSSLVPCKCWCYGQVVGGKGDGMPQETRPGTSGVEWEGWIGKPKKALSLTGGERTDDQYLKLENGVLRFFKDPFHATVRPRAPRSMLLFPPKRLGYVY